MGWLRIASTVFSKFFDQVEVSEKDKLVKIFFALYSFENLDFGYDAVLDLITVSNKMENYLYLAKKNWNIYSDITSNTIARENVESTLFGVSSGTVK